MSPGQVARTNGCRTVGVLELVQNLKGFGQFFGRGHHDASKLVFHVVLKLGYHVVSYLGYAVEAFLGFRAPARRDGGGDLDPQFGRHDSRICGANLRLEQA